MPTIELATAANCDAVLHRDLLSSPMIAGGDVAVHVQRGFPSASRAYNDVLSKSRADIIVFAHQDIYFPAPWLGQLQAVLAEEAGRSQWGAMGVWSITETEEFVGRVSCSATDQEYRGLSGVHRVASMDEIVIVVNRQTGLRFDDDLPGFHLYGADFSTNARKCGFDVLGITAPVVHNNRFNPLPFDGPYFAAYRYLRKKWRQSLPVHTTCGPVLPSMAHLYRMWVHYRLRQLAGRSKGHSTRSRPADWAIHLGYEQQESANACRPF